MGQESKSGLENEIRLTATLTDKQFDTHIEMEWWHQIFYPFLESIRPWKGLNFGENVQLYELEHCIF
jgi:hypothetical protein